MILAAGLGTRLRPLTDHTAKPLLDIGGMPLLERIARRLVEAGADRLIINVHHHGEQIEAFVEQQDGFGVDVRISREPDQPLDTGGGLWHARQHFRQETPFFLHNGDILSDAPLAALHSAHCAGDVLATLAVRPASESRYLIFDDHGLVGFSPRGGGDERIVRDVVGTLQRWDFAGIHVIDPRIFGLLTERGVFSIVDAYLRLSREGERVVAFPFEGLWLDIGTPERLAEADRLARRTTAG